MHILYENAHYLQKNKKIKGIYNSQKNVINFINQCSNEFVQPFSYTKLLTFHDYKYKYFQRHQKISYYTARLMYSLNNYGFEKKKIFKDNDTLFRGAKTKYTNLLPFERALGKVVTISNFNSTTKNRGFYMGCLYRYYYFKLVF